MNLLPVQETKQQHPTTAIPSLKELEDMLITLDNNEEGGTLKIKETTRVIIQTCKDRKELIEKLTREISAQSIALNSALNNLESHVETAHQNVRKFDRIAQREFAKDAIAIASVDLEIELLQQINLHPRVIKNMTKPVSSNALSLADFVPITQLQTIKKTSLLKEYDELVSATLEQNNKMAHLNQQTANACVHRTTSEAVIGRVTKIKQQVNRFVDVLIDLEKKIFEELENKRTTETSENAIAVDSPSSADTPFLPHSPPFLDAKGKRYFSSSSDIHASTSPHTIPLLSPPLLPTYSTRRKRMKGKKDIIGDGMRLFYLYDQLICDSENNVLEEKKKTFEGFIYRMQSISQVEQSITQIYPKLAELEKRIKWLRFEIERGQGALARKVITGYGMLLCELWRRDTYSEIVMKNTHLLGELFAQFGKMEEKYRRNFIENEIVCLEEREDQHILSHIQQNQQQSIIPFLIQDLNSAPVICQTSTTISNKEQNTISKKDVETYIQMVHSFYVNYNHDNKEQNNTVLSFDVSSMLSRKLEREAKRLNKGLAQLGLPSTNNNNSSNKKHVQLNNVPTKDLNSSSKNSTQNDSNTMNRNATFSSPPSSPVMNDKSKDWELDRTLILNQFQEYKEHIKLFQLKHEQYEKEKQNLLDELNHKERCIEEIQIEHQQEIQNLLQMVEAKEASQQNEIRKPLLSPPQEEQVR
ncbi:MAG: hypothetical protein EXX96DRAFT_247117 [Benjaminiella poitrasii]|nr:MAG: hypothetical protein EXX96DRAFT_247117 [Benjaminiella poitrasii]